jgi:hypothetical protein
VSLRFHLQANNTRRNDYCQDDDILTCLPLFPSNSSEGGRERDLTKPLDHQECKREMRRIRGDPDPASPKMWQPNPNRRFRLCLPLCYSVSSVVMLLGFVVQSSKPEPQRTQRYTERTPQRTASEVVAISFPRPITNGIRRKYP